MMSELYPSFPLFPHSREGGNLFLLALLSPWVIIFSSLLVRDAGLRPLRDIGENVRGSGLQPFRLSPHSCLSAEAGEGDNPFLLALSSPWVIIQSSLLVRDAGLRPLGDIGENVVGSGLRLFRLSQAKGLAKKTM